MLDKLILTSVLCVGMSPSRAVNIFDVSFKTKPVDGGGYSAIFRGHWNGISVALKQLKPHSRPEKVLKVRYIGITRLMDMLSRFDSYSTALHSRIHHMGTSEAYEYPPLSWDVYRPCG